MDEGAADWSTAVPVTITRISEWRIERRFYRSKKNGNLTMYFNYRRGSGHKREYRPGGNSEVKE